MLDIYHFLSFDKIKIIPNPKFFEYAFNGDLSKLPKRTIQPFIGSWSRAICKQHRNELKRRLIRIDRMHTSNQHLHVFVAADMLLYTVYKKWFLFSTPHVPLE